MNVTVGCRQLVAVFSTHARDGRHVHSEMLSGKTAVKDRAAKVPSRLALITGDMPNRQVARACPCSGRATTLG